MVKKLKIVLKALLVASTVLVSPRAMSAEQTEAPLRYLSLHGGGMWGISSILLLEQIERHADTPIAELVDGIIGVSIGSITAASLCTPGENGQPRYTVAELKQSFVRNSREVFSPGAIATFRADKNFDRLMQQKLGNAYLSRSLCHLMMSAYHAPSQKFEIFDSEVAKEKGRDLLTWQAARASASLDIPVVGVLGPGSVTYNDSELASGFTDPGLQDLNNPTEQLIERLSLRYPHRKIVIYSLGTGRERAQGDAHPPTYTYSREDGRIEVVHLEPNFDGFAMAPSFVWYTKAIYCGLNAFSAFHRPANSALVGLNLFLGGLLFAHATGPATPSSVNVAAWHTSLLDSSADNIDDIARRTQELFSTAEYAKMFEDLTGKKWEAAKNN